MCTKVLPMLVSWYHWMVEVGKLECANLGKNHIQEGQCVHRIMSETLIMALSCEKPSMLIIQQKGIHFLGSPFGPVLSLLPLLILLIFHLSFLSSGCNLLIFTCSQKFFSCLTMLLLFSFSSISPSIVVSPLSSVLPSPNPLNPES